jgi:hypothetical protein
VPHNYSDKTDSGIDHHPDQMDLEERIRAAGPGEVIPVTAAELGRIAAQGPGPAMTIPAHASDCAVHSEPADPAGDCDCGAEYPDGISFSAALYAVKEGLRAARRGWTGKGMFIFLVPGSTFYVSRAPLLGIYPEGTQIDYHAHIDMALADGQIVPWLASQTDLLAHDWMVIEDKIETGAPAEAGGV